MDYTIKASFKGGYGVDRGQFRNKVCFLPISVGMLNHEDGKFQATLDLIDKNFEKCVIQIDDTVQRHTLRIKEQIADEEAFLKTKVLGDEWLNRNLQKIETLNIDYEVIRWFRWTEDDAYLNFLKKIKNTYSKDVLYRKTIDLNVEDFLMRRATRYKDNDYLSKEAYALCLDYLQEECAVMLMWAETGYDIELYPTGRNQAMQMTYETMIEPYFPNILKSVELRFKKYGNLNPTMQNQRRIVSLDEIPEAVGA